MRKYDNLNNYYTLMENIFPKTKSVTILVGTKSVTLLVGTNARARLVLEELKYGCSWLGLG